MKFSSKKQKEKLIGKAWLERRFFLQNSGKEKNSRKRSLFNFFEIS
jgi:hypothetical protein